ncbi:hypothetical protein [Massilia yuzhufengensis]|uniref:Uncharacterized protein n=1 Tax=Massilia yuzhufengensis TaxID=1164594 RepID=A0A1I1F014_9BURK|nr:hypothetical protein [Massilia yuzhufengensis]SFB90520.1 hypothetical protein SAMN05216204_102242 [Massilia yuzhufengensis]
MHATTLGFKRDRDLDAIDGVAYGRYVLPAAGLQAALDQLRNFGVRSDIWTRARQ